MKILAIETSADDTCAAVLENDRVWSSVISSQTDLHSKWGGVVPDIAKRAHQERIVPVILTTLKRARIKMEDVDVIAVTQGRGLAVALGVGISTAKELAKKYNKKLIAVNHVEGHILSNLVKNREGNPNRRIEFPSLALTVSGGHTKIVLVRQNPSKSPFDKGDLQYNFSYEVVGETLDDAAGEALDKASKHMGLGYPGGPIIERLALKGDSSWMKLPRPMSGFKGFDYSFSGLKTSFYYQIKEWPREKINQNLANLAASYQRAVFETLIMKYKKAIEFYKPKSLMASGGVMANLTLRKELRKMAKKIGLPIYMPVKKELNTDNAMMIGLVGYFKALRGEFVEDIDSLERNPRMEL